ncbi:MAG: EamA family transporter [Eubacteriaceae bacterium]
MNDNNPKSNIFKSILQIQLCILFFSIINVLSKHASSFQFLSWKFFGIYFLILVMFFIYAIIWQILLGKNDLFVVYSNRAMLPVWSLLWGILFFSEKIHLNNILGILLIIGGIIVIFINDKS